MAMRFNKTTLTISLMLAMFLAAVEGTIVTMATPTIIRDLHGFEMVSLVFSIYLLTSAISTPIYGKLADLYGRKKMFSIGILIFLLGSFLCGFAQNMIMLIAFRALQGLGAGSIFTVSYTIIGDEFPLEERTKIQGGLNTVWGIASLIGPFLGGFLIDTLSWHWIFFINIPFGLISVFLLSGSLQESLAPQKHRIDYLGTGVLSAAVILFMGIFLFGPNLDSYRLPFMALSALGVVLLLSAFHRIEKNTAEPIISFEIFTRLSIMVNLISFLVYAVLIGFDVYIPIYLQSVLGYRPTWSGLAMLPMSVSWLMVSFVLGKLLLNYGGKAVTIGANMVILLSTGLLLTLGVDSSVIPVLVYGFVIGIGFGAISTTLTITVQDSVDYGRRGTAVAANALLRTLGQTIGISIFGSIFNSGITSYFAARGINSIGPANLYSASPSPGGLPIEQIPLSLNSALHLVFIGLIAISCLSLFLSILMPKVSGKAS